MTMKLTRSKIWLGVALVALVCSTLGVAKTSAAAEPGYLTIMWGRSSWEQAGSPNCANLSGTRHLRQNADDMRAAGGLWGVGGVVIDRTNESTNQCAPGNILQASWDNLRELRDTYGWKFISQSKSYTNLVGLPKDQLYEQTGGTLAALRAHGHVRAWGAFSYPNGAGSQDTTVQNMVAQFFAFGRTYDDTKGGVNTKAASTVFPFPMNTLSVTGGRCNNASLPCATLSTPRKTMAPIFLANKMLPAAGKWNVVQFYRLVEGQSGTVSDYTAWDCTSSDWKNRWTSQPELYCRNSFQEALALRQSMLVPGSVQVVDPAGMATKWGRIPPSMR